VALALAADVGFTVRDPDGETVLVNGPHLDLAAHGRLAFSERQVLPQFLEPVANGAA
jgi:hypothetical protein